MCTICVTVPCFPSGKVLFRRSHIRDVAVKRLKHLDNYCKVRLCLILSFCVQAPTPHALLPEHWLLCFQGKPQHLSPPPASTGKQLLYLCWSLPVTNVNRQPIKETRETGARRSETESRGMNQLS